MSSSYAIYYSRGLSRLPPPQWPNQESNFHFKMLSSLFALTLYAYYKSATTDPGFLTKKSLKKAIKRYEYDERIYISKEECPNCKFNKPARSYHCSKTNMCIEKYQHYCIWINQAVGRRNYKSYLSLLFFQTALCSYAFWLGVYIQCGEVSK